MNEDLTPELRRGLTIRYVDEMDEVLNYALTPARPAVVTEEERRQRLSLA